MNDDLKMYTVREVGEILKLSIKSVRVLIWSGDLKHVRAGRAYRVTKDQLNEYLGLK